MIRNLKLPMPSYDGEESLSNSSHGTSSHGQSQGLVYGARRARIVSLDHARALSRNKGRPIKDFAKDLEKLAIRYPDVDEYAIRRIFWEGVDGYIQVFWAEKGRSLEYDDMNTLLIYAQRAEKRERVKRKLTKQGNSYGLRDDPPARSTNSTSNRGSQSGRGSRWRPRGGNRRGGRNSTSTRPTSSDSVKSSAATFSGRAGGSGAPRAGVVFPLPQSRAHGADLSPAS